MTLKEAMAEDAPVFVNSDEFGIEAVLSLTGETINILVDNEQDQETGLIIPIVTVRTSDVVGISAGDTLTTASSRVYTVVSIEPVAEDDLFTTLRVYE